MQLITDVRVVEILLNHERGDENHDEHAGRYHRVLRLLRGAG